MRVHELAKELNISSKDLCSYLSDDKKEYKAMSGLTDEEITKAKGHFKPAVKEEKKTEEAKGDGEHKVSKLFFPQNSSKKDGRGHGKDNKQQHNKPVDKKQEHSKDNRTERKPQGQGNTQTKEATHQGGQKKFEGKNDRFEKKDRKGQQGFKSDDRRGNDRRNDSKPGDRQKKEGGFKDKNQGKNQNQGFAPAGDVKKGGKDERRHSGKFNNKDKEKNKGKNKEGDINSIEMLRPKKKKKEEEIKLITLPEYISLKDFASMIKQQPSALIKKLFLQGKVVTVNTELSYEEAEEIALEYDVLCEHEVKVDVIAELLKDEEDEESKLTSRPPVVAVMGHVDHGKTSLLDAIRKTHVTDKESGGITQKIGAYQVKTKSGSLITFLDTPGHEAFTAMRMRGAQATDIAILVVAADDGVMPQTIEAIDHAKAAEVEIIVAINKIDKPTANIDRVKQELMEHGLVPEEWGGSNIFVPVSAHTGDGIEDLLEMIMLTADVMELKANKKRMARGIVIEAELDKGKGVVASVLIQKGTLHLGNAVEAGSSHGKIRAIINDKGQNIKEAGPSVPVEILGLNQVPNAGEILMAFGNDKEARSFAETFVSENKKRMVDESKHRVTLDDLFDQIKAGNIKELNLIVKADVQGSVEAIRQSLEKLSNDEVAVKIIHSGVGNISESDVILASASNAIIIGFGVKLDNQAKSTADVEDVDIRFYSVIYHAINDIEAALKGMLEPIYEKQITGHAEIRQIFKASGVGNIAGAVVTDGKIKAHALCTVTRDGEVIYDGKIATLKRFKDDVKEVKGGYECGIVFDNFGNIQEGDIVEAAEMVEIPRT